MNNRIWGMIAAVGVAWINGGCSDSGASAGAGGASGTGFAGNGGALPLPNQGSVTLTVARSLNPSNGQACPVPGQTYPAGQPAPTNLDPGGALVDGEDGAQVTCSVHGAGPFTFSGSLQATTTDGASDPVHVAFTQGSIGADLTGTADVSVYTPQLAGNFSGVSCQVQVIGSQIKAGSMWASFSCPSLVEPPSSQCAASGVFVFENCDGS
jgi:hypothetical protein